MSWGFGRGMQLLKEMVVGQPYDYYSNIGQPNTPVNNVIFGGRINDRFVGPVVRSSAVPPPLPKAEFIISKNVLFRKRAARILYGKEGEDLFLD